MENTENNVTAMENTGAVDAASNTTLGKKVLGGLIGTCVVVGTVTIIKKAIGVTRNLIGKLSKPKADEQGSCDTVASVSEDETE